MNEQHLTKTKIKMLLYMYTIKDYTVFTELARNMEITQQAVVLNLKDLQREGYIRKKERSKYQVTSKGYNAIKIYFKELYYYLKLVFYELEDLLTQKNCSSWEFAKKIESIEDMNLICEPLRAVLYFSSRTRLFKKWGGHDIEQDVKEILELKEELSDTAPETLLIKLAILYRRLGRVSNLNCLDEMDRDPLVKYHIVRSIFGGLSLVEHFSPLAYKLTEMSEAELKELLKLHSEQNFN